MNKIDKLNHELKKLESQKTALTSLDDLTLFQFLKQKRIKSRESKIMSQLQKRQKMANKINFLYDTNTKSWIENPNINCNQYHKMQQKAEYQRNLKLYKIGYLSQRPLPPLLKKLTSYLPKTVLLKFNFLKKSNQNHNSLETTQFPKKFNNLAVSTAKVGIRGYRTLRSNCKYIRNYLTSRNSIKYIKNIISEAKDQIDQAEAKKILHTTNITSKGVQFRESLKFNPDIAGITSTTINNSRKKVPYPTTRISATTLESHAEYSL